MKQGASESKDVADQVKAKKGQAPDGYEGGREFANDGRGGTTRLPDGVKYREYDVNPTVEGQSRGAERIVIGEDGSVWYTDDHYQTFTQIE
ncbi:MAG: hypothetical protein HY665_03260 [Chloroflexi bacterium]|nr:hypothetical protein [Chloroflexota bacterium]